VRADTKGHGIGTIACGRLVKCAHSECLGLIGIQT
jgi:hypothetical protein